MSTVYEVIHSPQTCWTNGCDCIRCITFRVDRRERDRRSELDRRIQERVWQASEDRRKGIERRVINLAELAANRER